MPEHDLVGELDAFLEGHEPELVEFRRDLHAHPEVGYSEHRTTRRSALRLEAAGLKPSVLPKGTGVIADIGGGPQDEPVVALRADIDALPITDEKSVPYRSLNAGACHACASSRRPSTSSSDVTTPSRKRRVASPASRAERARAYGPRGRTAISLGTLRAYCARRSRSQA